MRFHRRRRRPAGRISLSPICDSRCRVFGISPLHNLRHHRLTVPAECAIFMISFSCVLRRSFPGKRWYCDWDDILMIIYAPRIQHWSNDGKSHVLSGGYIVTLLSGDAMPRWYGIKGPPIRAASVARPRASRRASRRTRAMRACGHGATANTDIPLAAGQAGMPEMDREAFYFVNKMHRVDKLTVVMRGDDESRRLGSSTPLMQCRSIRLTPPLLLLVLIAKHISCAYIHLLTKQPKAPWPTSAPYSSATHAHTTPRHTLLHVSHATSHCHMVTALSPLFCFDTYEASMDRYKAGCLIDNDDNDDTSIKIVTTQMSSLQCSRHFIM